MGIIAWLALGLVVGLLANAFLGRQRSLFGTVLLGVLGAYAGGNVGAYLFGVSVTGFDIPSLLLALIGAVVVLIVFDFVTAVGKEL